MGNERGDLWLTFNGEIYNHLSLRPSLVEAGHAFRSRCDAEVILHGYESEGARFFRRLEGMHAFALLEGKDDPFRNRKHSRGAYPPGSCSPQAPQGRLSVCFCSP